MLTTAAYDMIVPMVSAPPPALSNEAHFLVIVNYIPPYDQEVVSLLAAPTGARAEFRFQRKYVPTLPDVGILAHRDGLICLRDRTTGLLYPLRQAHMCRSRWMADIAYMSVELASTAALYEDDALAAQLREFRVAMDTAIGSFSNLGETDLRNLVLLEQVGILEQVANWENFGLSNELDRWSSMISVISNDVRGPVNDFLRFVETVDEKGKQLQIYGPVGERAFVLTPGGSYRASILQRTFTGAVGDSSLPRRRDLEVSSNHSDITITDPKRQLVGKYGVSSFAFAVNPSAHLAYSSLIVTLTGEGLTRNSTFEMPVQIARRGSALGKYVAFQVLWVLALLSYIFPNAVLSLLTLPSVHLGEAPTQSQVEKSAILILILTSQAGIPVAKWVAERLKLG